MVRFTDSSFFSALSLVVVCSAIIEHSPLLAGTRFGILAADTRVSANTTVTSISLSTWSVTPGVLVNAIIPLSQGKRLFGAPQVVYFKEAGCV